MPSRVPRFGRLAAELVVIFVGVTAAFFVENYRERLAAEEDLSGVASQYEPDLRFRLGYFYDEMVGIHTNYQRHLAFIESEVLPRAEIGPAAFYDDAGRFDPAVRARLDLLDEFAADLRRWSTMAGELADELEATMELT